MDKLIDLLKRNPNGMTAANVGLELWNKRPDEMNPARYCRPAGRLLKKAQAERLVREEWRNGMRLWFAR